jgi:hypothetical protein
VRAAIQRRADVLRIQVELFLLAAQHATPGPWDALDGWVISTSMKEANDDSNDFYGGALIGESRSARALQRRRRHPLGASRRSAMPI